MNYGLIDSQKPSNIFVRSKFNNTITNDNLPVLMLDNSSELVSGGNSTFFRMMPALRPRLKSPLSGSPIRIKALGDSPGLKTIE